MQGGPQETSDARGPRGLYALLALVIGVAVALRLYALGRLPGINGDEAWYGVVAQQLGEGGLAGLRTPNGNLPGPLQLGALALLLQLFPPSLVLLRVPSVLASLAMIGLGYVVGKRSFDRPTAWVLATLIAVLPVHVAYARMGWDPSHSGLVMLAATAFALRVAIVPCALCFALALLVHPTNLFVAPFLACVAAGAELAGAERWRVPARSALLALALLASTPLVSLTTSAAAASPPLSEMTARIASPAEWLGFARAFARFVSGETVCAYVTGAGFASHGPAAELLVGVTSIGLCAWSARALGVRRPSLGMLVLVGWLASLAAFFVAAGPSALAPHAERYGVCLALPTVFALTLMLRTVAHAGLRTTRTLALVAAMSIALLSGLHAGYIVPLEDEGSTSHETFWTGAHEPKQVAWQRMRAEASGRGDALVVVDSYWLYQPLAYLSHGGPLHVATVEQALQGPLPPLPGGIYWVDFPTGKLASWMQQKRIAKLRWNVAAGPRPDALKVFWSAAPTAPVAR